LKKQVKNQGKKIQSQANMIKKLEKQDQGSKIKKLINTDKVI
jgi:hypothetical protein